MCLHLLKFYLISFCIWAWAIFESFEENNKKHIPTKSRDSMDYENVCYASYTDCILISIPRSSLSLVDTRWLSIRGKRPGIRRFGMD